MRCQRSGPCLRDFRIDEAVYSRLSPRQTTGPRRKEPDGGNAVGGDSGKARWIRPQARGGHLPRPDPAGSMPATDCRFGRWICAEPGMDPKDASGSPTEQTVVVNGIGELTPDSPPELDALDSLTREDGLGRSRPASQRRARQRQNGR